MSKICYFTWNHFTLVLVLGIIHFYRNDTDSALWYFERAEKLAEESGDKMTLASVVMNQATLYNSLKSTNKALKAYERALKIEKERGNKVGEAAASNNIGTIFLDQKNYEKAEQYFLAGLNIQEELGAKPTMVIILVNLGLVASFQNELKKSISYYEQALALTRERQDKVQESKVLIKMALAYKMNGQFAQSLDCYLKNLKLWESLKSDRKISFAIGYLAKLYEENDQFEMAETYYAKAIHISKKIENNYILSSNLADLSSLYIKQEKYRKALDHLIHASHLQAQSASNSERVSANIFQRMGSCYQHLNLLDSASFFLTKARKICENFRAEDTHIQTLLSLAKISEKSQDIPKAISLAEEALEIASTAGLKKLQSQSAESLYLLHKEKNNTSAALSYLELHKSLQDSLFNKENTRALVQMEAKYKFEQEKQQLSFEQEQKLNEEKNTQKAILAALVVAILIILAFAWYYYQKQRANRLLKRLNTEISEQKQKLEEMDQVKSRFFTNISHEFRTPLTVIGGMVDQIRTQPKKWTEKGLNLIQSNSNQLLDLVNQILDLRKLESGSLSLNVKQGNIIFYLNYVFESFQALAENKDIDLHFLCELEELWMDFDREKLLRVLSNLISNAIKFTHAGGNIYLMVDKVSDSSEVGQAYLKLTVKDTGIGIPQEKLGFIFDRFYQLDTYSSRTGQGTGIGLALSKELVHLMNGEIEVESKAEKGSSFSISLPISKEASPDTFPGEEIQYSLPLNSQAEATSPILNAPLLQRAHKLLIVEDNTDVISYLQSILGDTYQLILAHDGKTGIDLAIAEVPDLIISDVMMPIKDGFELCATLKEDERSSHIPIILLTAKADNDSRLTGLKRGADAYLTKPFDKAELLIRLEQLQKLRHRLQQRYQHPDLVEKEEVAEIKQEDAFMCKVRNIIEENIQNPDLGVDLLCES
ncbi:MAG: tetratricopeptide repeat protein, partial [Bacteroidota bacterium]